MISLKFKVAQVKDKLKELNEFKQDQAKYAEFLAYNTVNFFTEHPKFDVWLYTLLQADLEARLDELNKDINNEKSN